MGRPRLHDERLRERLLDLASQAVTDGGRRALSVRTLAAAAETSTAAVYTLFGGMPGLVTELYARSFDRLDDGQRAVAASDDPLRDVAELGRAYRATALADPNGYRMMFGGGVPAEVPDELRARAARAFEPLVDAVRRGVDAGLLRDEPAAEAIATALWATSHGLVALELGGFLPPEAAAPASIFDLAIRAGVDGWRPGP